MRTRKRFGQHFLEPPWAERVVAAIDPAPCDRFLEIGPGPGALTIRLAPRVAHLTAIEIDRDLAAALAPRLPPAAEVVVGDVLETDLLPLLREGPLRIAGNLPYNISSPILFRLIALSREARGPGGANPVVDATVMLQREVADRVTAPPGTGDYGVLSVSVQLYADVRRVLALPPGAFRPVPAVHSAVVHLRFRPPLVHIADEGTFEAMLRAAFTQRRKTLSNSLRTFAETRGREAGAALAAAGIDPGRRAETLSLEELARLANRFAGRPAG